MKRILNNMYKTSKGNSTKRYLIDRPAGDKEVGGIEITSIDRSIFVDSSIDRSIFVASSIDRSHSTDLTRPISVSISLSISLSIS